MEQAPTITRSNSTNSTRNKKRGNEIWATGRRKTAIARVRVKSGNGAFIVNEKPAHEYFARPTLMMILGQPFEATNTVGKFDIMVNVCGGGLAGQAGAVRHGIARALLSIDAENRKALKQEGHLTRDAREKERRKVGRRKARRRPQYSKR